MDEEYIVLLALVASTTLEHGETPTRAGSTLLVLGEIMVLVVWTAKATGILRGELVANNLFRQPI